MKGTQLITMKVRSTTIFFSSVMILLFHSCNKKEIPIHNISSHQYKILENLDSIYLIAQQVYLWNDQLPAIDRFNPKQFFTSNTNEIHLYRNEIFHLTRYPKNNTNKLQYEYNPFHPYLAKYSSIISRIPSIKENDDNLNYNLSNPFGISIVIENNVIRLLYVDLNSPAGKAGLTRGMQVISVNSETINSEQSFLKQLTSAKNISYIKLEILDLNQKKREVRLNAALYEENPVVKKAAIEKGNIKIGYIAYNNFTIEGNSKKYLEQAFLAFEQAKVSELIVDLRYNQGGYQASVNFLANLIAPISINNKVMYTEHYNNVMQNGKAEILKQQRLLDEYGEPAFIEGDPVTLFDIDYSVRANTVYFNKESGLKQLKKINFIVSDMTASASELLINVLKPHIDTRIIGVSKSGQAEVYTYGKPIGFFGIRVDQYDLFLSMYLLKNSRNEGNYFEGIKADYSVIDDTRSDFGSKEDPAIALILKENIQDKKSNNYQSQTDDHKKNHSSYYFNDDRLKGNIKTTKDLKIKKYNLKFN